MRLSQNVQHNTSKIGARYTSAYNRWLGMNEQLRPIEEEFGISQRWQPGTPEHQEGLGLLSRSENIELLWINPSA